jgi:CHAT domain-containing protein/Tfp pilus assembly protein PilF
LMIPGDYRSIWTKLLGLALASLVAPAVAADVQQEKTCSGLVVEQVPPAMKNAGFQPGDIILSWKRANSPPANPQPAQGCLDSLHDFWEVTIEQLPRGPVTLNGRRGSQEMSWPLSEAAFWGLGWRPSLQEKLLVLFEEGKSLAAAGKVEEGLQKLRQGAGMAGEDTPVVGLFLDVIAQVRDITRNWAQQDAVYAEGVEIAKRHGDLKMARWLLVKWAWARRGRADLKGAEEKYQEALTFGQQLAPDSLVTAFNLCMLGDVAYSQNKWSEAEDYYQRALSIRERHVPGSLLAADTLNDLASYAWYQGKLDEAEILHRRALAIREKLTPGSAVVAASLMNIGLVAWERGEMATAEKYLDRALALDRELNPGSLGVANALYNLGALAWKRGDLPTAERRLVEALELQVKTAPMSDGVSFTSTVLANVQMDRGDLSAAEEHYQFSLQINEKLHPDGLEVATALNNLGSLAESRMDLDAARAYYRRALEIKERVAREDPAHNATLATSLRNLGDVTHNRGDLVTAEAHYRRALQIQRNLTTATGKQDLAETLRSLGRVARDREDLQAAEEFYGEALKIDESLSPGSVRVASTLGSLGGICWSRHDFQAATNYYRRALEILEKLAPGSSDLAWTRYQVGRLEREQGHAAAAAGHFVGALQALESQERKLGGAPEIRAGFAAGYKDLYREAIDFFIEQGRGDEALGILERSRARLLLNMLAERDLLFAPDLPAEIAEERRLTNGEYDRVQAAIAELNPEKDKAKVESYLNRLRELRDKREQIAVRIRQVAPGFASLQYPQPLSVPAVRNALDPGTTLLSYTVGDEKSFLFVVSAGSPELKVWTLNIGESALRDKVNAFRNVIARRDEASLRLVNSQGSELYELLVRPAESTIASSTRVLISPDGPLHLLPFAALVRNQASGRGRTGGQYLIEWKPLHQVISATVYAELRGRRKEFTDVSTTLVAFGDPRYLAIDQSKREAIGDPELRSVVRGGFGFASLPSSRGEVESIVGLYPGSSRRFLGEEATEERAKSIGKDVRYLHFACHGLIDERFPLNSALALTIPQNVRPGQDNGLLQAWEVFEHVRLDADLVTLSACETALGKEMGGEGLLGLTQAFQYAGARSVLASLWGVADESTALLMKRFYGHLKGEKAKADALRLAQMDLIKARAGSRASTGISFSHPFHWAAFQLIGDWW